MAASRDTPPEPLQRPHEVYETEILRQAWDRLHVDNEHFMLAIVGEEGIGKSLTGLKIAKAIDPGFDESQVIFDVSELLRRLRDDDYREGQAFVLDEAGVSLGRRTWQDRGQIKVNQALQLIRSHNLALIFTLPALGELDSQSVTRLQAFYEITTKNPGKHVRGKWKEIDPDRSDETGTTYKKYPQVTRDGITIKVDRMTFTPPEGDFVDSYHELKEEHQKRVYEEALAELEEDEETESDSGKGPKDVAEEIAKDGIEPYVSKNNSTKEAYINKDLIRVDYGISHSDATAAKKLLERSFSESQLEEYI